MSALPKFTIRTFLWLTAGLAVLSAVVAQAIRGQTWARATSIAIGFVALAFVFYGITYATAFVISLRQPESTEPTSPFAGEAPPEQIMVPVEQFPKT